MSDAGLVLAKGHIETPMTTVFDGPVTAHRASEAFHAQWQTADIVSFLNRFFPITHASRNGYSDRSQLLPLSFVRQVTWCREVRVTACLLATVSRFGRFVLTNLDTLKVLLDEVVNVFDDRLVKRSLVALQRQHIVGLLIDDLCGNRLLCPHGALW